MIGHLSPMCPISFGFIGFLGAIVSRRSAVWSERDDFREQYRNSEEEVDELLMTSIESEYDDCAELSDKKISEFLESQRMRSMKRYVFEL